MFIIVESTPVADAGMDQELCAESETILTGNEPYCDGENVCESGMWSVISGTAAITDPTLYNSTVTGLIAGSSVMLEWTVTNASGYCSASDTMTIFVSELPYAADAGPDQQLCNEETTTLSGNTPLVGTGTWSVISGTATIMDDMLPTTDVSDLIPGTVVQLQWTITNGICPPSSDTMMITIDMLPDEANAGPDQFLCNQIMTMLDGDPSDFGDELWTIISGSATFQSARVAVGLDYDARSNTVWVAGGPTGSGYVYDGDTGETISVLTLASSASTFVNDVVVTRDTAYFTESFQAVIYAADLDRRGFPTGEVEILPLSGDYDFFPGQFNANGIVATPSGDTLIIVNSFTGSLYTVDGDTGATVEIDLGSENVTNGDGMLLDGKTIYVVQNFFNQISVVDLSSDFASCIVSGVITDPDFMIPTTVAEFGNSLYAVNARFDVVPGPLVEYDVVRVDK
jgi:hypothetical protein